MRLSTLFTLLALLCLAGCFVDRQGVRRPGVPLPDAGTEMDAAGVDAARSDGSEPSDTGPGIDANCSAGTVDVDGDPANGCECTLGTPSTEVCNGVDDDCDPGTLDGAGERLLAMPCDGEDADRCPDGSWICSMGTLLCTDLPEDTFEMCGTGIDEDCDGASDESTAIDVTTWYRDADMDGYGNPAESVTSCTIPLGYVTNMSDCDDSTAARSPDIAETCNGRDDNCSGFADDGGCPCDVRHFGGVPYMFCGVGVGWSGARSFCEGFGYRFVKIENMPENVWISATAASLGGGGWWIGLSEGSGGWDWTDGSRASYTNWQGGQPDDGSSVVVTEDCVEINGFGTDTWNDNRCERDRRFVCEYP